MRKILFVILILFISFSPLFSQSVEDLGLDAVSENNGDEDQRAMAASAGVQAERENLESNIDITSGTQLIQETALLAMTTESYLVTPGDVYIISYVHSYSTSSIDVVVESDYTLNLAVFGSINARGMTFFQLRREVIELIEEAYPSSRPQIIISGIGVFQVQVTGEVTRTGLVQANGMTRLDSLVLENRSSHGSIRRVRVTGSQGETEEYDLFSAFRLGAADQNPYVRPGDVIEVLPHDNVAVLRGNVHRAGTYQYLENETLEDLIYRYGRGLNQNADIRNIRIVHRPSIENPSGWVEHISGLDSDLSEIQLSPYDTVEVGSIGSYLPSMVIEGAVGSISSTGGAPNSNRIEYRFTQGQRLSTTVQEFRDRFSAVSDLENAYLERNGERTYIDLTAFLESPDPETDIALRQDDTLVVPFRNRFVTVSGAVVQPGRYPYVPNENWEYYIELAGGFDPTRNSGEVVSVVNAQEEPKDRNTEIMPGDEITAETNAVLYHVGRFSVVISAAATLTSMVISILNFIQ
ncbi:MAG: SLBB domain-containing protein [Spirochaetia bacterium]